MIQETLQECMWICSISPTRDLLVYEPQKMSYTLTEIASLACIIA